MSGLEYSLEAFSRAVDSVYDCAVNPQNWPATLRLVGELTDSPNMGLGIIDHAEKRQVYAANFGYEPSYEKSFRDHFAGTTPFFMALHLKPVGGVYTLADLMDEDEFLESEFYKKWAKPQGLRHYMGIHALRSGPRSARFSAIRMESQTRYTDVDVRLFRLLAPHVCRAISISDALELRTITSQALEAALSALATAIYFTDRESRVVYMNRAAEHQIKKGDVLGIVNSHLTSARHDVQPSISEAIASANKDVATASMDSVTLAIPDRANAGLVMTILPLDRGERRGLSGPSAATAAIFVQDPIVVSVFPGEAFAKLYGLTGSELRVLLAMAPGLGVKEAGDMLGVAETTAKTHLQRIYEKTRTSKQTELMNLLRSSTPPIAAPQPK